MPSSTPWRTSRASGWSCGSACAPPGLPRETADRHLAPLREQQRAGDRRGGHHQHVRPRALTAELQPLLHAEPVLLVDHGQTEVAIRSPRLGTARESRSPAGTYPEPDALRARPAAPRSFTDPVSMTTGTGERAEIVRKCCLASSSVGAISAACSPASATRSIAMSATRVLPDPTSPCSSRSIRVGWPRSASISANASAWAGVMGKPEPPQGLVHAAARRIADRPPRPLPLALPRPAERQLLRQNLVIGQARARAAGSGMDAWESAPPAAHRRNDGHRSLLASNARFVPLGQFRHDGDHGLPHRSRGSAPGTAPAVSGHTGSNPATLPPTSEAGATRSGLRSCTRPLNRSTLPDTASPAPILNARRRPPSEERDLAEARAVPDDHLRRSRRPALPRCPRPRSAASRWRLPAASAINGIDGSVEISVRHMEQ